MNWFLWPGEKACDLVGLTDPDDRLGFRLFVNLIFWNLVMVLVAVVVLRLFPNLIFP